jgi:hypothetical protein
MEILISRYTIPESFFPVISGNFRKVVAHPGKFVACDEKLSHFTGNSGFIRKVPSKPDGIGLWLYEMVCILGVDKYFLLDFWLCKSNSLSGIKEPVNEVVSKWSQSMSSYAPQPVLVYDSYYTDNTGVKKLLDGRIPFMASFRMDRFKEVKALIEKNKIELAKPGCSMGFTRSDNTLMVMFHWSLNTDIGKKTVMSNCFIEKPKTRNSSTDLPIYTDYKKNFFYCDRYNRNLHDKLYPHKCGGNNKMGEFGHLHKFCMGVTLQNIFVIYEMLNIIPDNEKYFKNHCFSLAKLLVSYALSL